MKNLAYLILLSSSVLLCSCENFLDVGLPASQLTSDKVFEDSATADAAMTDIYSKLRDSSPLTGLSSGLSANFGMYADELDYYGSDVEPGLPFNNSILASSSITTKYWNESYHIIYCCNAVVEGVSKSSTLTQEVKDKLIGEALFIKALMHFYLVNIYGDIPYISVTDYEKNHKVERQPVKIVYENIIFDLTKAVQLLPKQYISLERARPNKYAAYALLARVFLYTQKWAEASDASSAVINSSLYTWQNNIDLIFLKDSSTTIWQFMPKRIGNNTDEALVNIFNSGPPPTIALKSDLVNAFESGDLRKSNWVRTVKSGTGTWYHSFKYKKNINTGTSVEYSVILRIAEQYLIRAEARAQQGDLIGAKEDLNKIRHTAGLSNTHAITKEEIIIAVLNERRFELFNEYGNRFFDLKRTGNINIVLGAIKPGWNTDKRLWPLPEKELLSNPFLKPQNTGY